VTPPASATLYWTSNAATTAHGGTPTVWSLVAATPPQGTASGWTSFGGIPAQGVSGATTLIWPGGRGVGRFELALGTARDVGLPDGCVLKLAADGNWVLEDKDARVVHRGSNFRAFNPYLNASDLLEAFVRDAGAAGVRQGEVLGLPVLAFVRWLVRQAAEADGVPAPAEAEPLALPAPPPRCGWCGRFVARAAAAASLPWCGPGHAARAAARAGVPGWGM
jgi:hypothetical protein